MSQHRAADEREREERLVDLARGGDTDAYSELVRIYQDSVYGLIRRLVSDDQTAEELTQDAFLKAYRSLAGFRGRARFFTWLYRIAVNACHDHRSSLAARGRKRESSLSDPELGEIEVPAPFSRPDEEVEGIEIAGDFQAALDGLEGSYREAFLLRHQEGLGYEELAGVLEISKSNAKVRVHRAREMILEALRARGHQV